MNTSFKLPLAHFPLQLNNITLAPLDLSINNKDLNGLHTAKEYENYINDLLTTNNATIAYGGYLEQRNLYKRSNIFNNADIEERDTHLGVDYWCAAATPILAAYSGTIHSFANNLGLGNYGPTIILQHKIDENIFHTLYGHLSTESLANLEIGQIVKEGQVIGSLGDETVNGNYAPHLHFQLIIDMQGKEGDYPGVCAAKDLDFYKANCPNPNHIFTT